MREFKDDEGRPWRLALTCASAARVKDLVQIDVTDEVDQPDGSVRRETRKVAFDIIDTSEIGRTLEVLRSRYGTVGEVLYAILIKQVDEKKLTKEQFLDGLRGDSIEAAIKALEEELADFFPLRLRKMVGLITAKLDEMTQQVMDQAEAKIAEVTLGASGNVSGNVPGSSESTPENGPFASSSPPVTVA